MATPSASELTIRIDEANHAHIGSGSGFLRRAMLEVGCGPGGITVDIAKRYPHLQVFGVDIDEASIEVRHGASIAFARVDGVVIVGTRRSDSSWCSKSKVHKR